MINAVRTTHGAGHLRTAFKGVATVGGGSWEGAKGEGYPYPLHEKNIILKRFFFDDKDCDCDVNDEF